MRNSPLISLIQYLLFFFVDKIRYIEGKIIRLHALFLYLQ